MSRKRKPLPSELLDIEISGLSHEGRGLASANGKTLFVDGALAGERVRVRYTRVQRRYDEGVVVEVLRASPERVPARCAHFGVCGGCSLQHMEEGAQIRAKQASLEDVFARIGKVEPERWLAPLTHQSWGYRRKARLGVRFVVKKGRTLVGFRERGNAFITDVSECEVLHPAVGRRIRAIAELIDTLSIRDQIPQIEVAMGDGAPVLVFRVLRAPSASDAAALEAFAQGEGFSIHLQAGGPETARPLQGEATPLYYDLPNQCVRVAFAPTDFTQVNLGINRAMVDQAIALLDPQPADRVLDLFCGLGNFTLPLARHAGTVVGVEGDQDLVARAQENARANALPGVRFYASDLYGELGSEPWLREPFNKAILDPPRSGAFDLLDWLPRLGVEQLLYVSCYPTTLARDADRLVNSLGYRMVCAGVMDMFPHTAHVESMAVFERRFLT